MAKLTTPILTTLLALAGLACESRCDEQQRTLELDEPGPFGASSRETFGFIEGTRTGTLWWSDLDEVDVEITTTLDASATAISRERRGHGRERLACLDTLVTWAHVRITTPDAVYFDDEVDVWLEQWDGELPERVEVTQTDVTHHEFEGLLIEPPSAVDDLGLTLRIVWRDDAAGSMQGWLMLGGDVLVRFDAVSN